TRHSQNTYFTFHSICVLPLLSLLKTFNKFSRFARLGIVKKLFIFCPLTDCCTFFMKLIMFFLQKNMVIGNTLASGTNLLISDS
ncbi:MAG: hypothetical protein LBS01_06400, partial [Prevotellaceae bacterium]|nr:hypothetical protein [Prevotellaceae bacterium]